MECLVDYNSSIPIDGFQNGIEYISRLLIRKRLNLFSISVLNKVTHVELISLNSCFEALQLDPLSLKNPRKWVSVIGRIRVKL